MHSLLYFLQASVAGASETRWRFACKIPEIVNICLPAESRQRFDYHRISNPREFLGNLWRSPGCWTGRSLKQIAEVTKGEWADHWMIPRGKSRSVRLLWSAGVVEQYHSCSAKGGQQVSAATCGSGRIKYVLGAGSLCEQPYCKKLSWFTTTAVDSCVCWLMEGRGLLRVLKILRNLVH